MKRSNKIAQMYGYAVCFVSVVTFLFATKGIIDACFDLSAPLRADRYLSGMNLTSFEAYKRDRVERRDRGAPGTVAESQAQPRTWTDEELRRMYEEEREDHADSVRFRAMRSLVSNLLMVVIASVLFVMHWRWLRPEPEEASA